MEILFSFLGGLVLAALIALFIARSVVKSRVAQTEQSVRLQAEATFKEEQVRLTVEQARLESDLEHAHAHLGELAASLEDARDEAERQLRAAKEETERQLRAEKDETERQLRAAKEETERQVKAAKEETERQVKAAKEEAARWHKEAMEALQARFDETMEKVSAQMKSETAEMLKARQKEFSETSHLSLGQIVDPLKENIAELRKAMEEGNKEQAERNGEMRERIRSLMEHSDAARKSAEELAAAFKHGSKMQGDWGETILEELLASQGLTKGVHFDTQPVIRDGDGKTVRNDDGSFMKPDVILHLDERREVIIDSKVSLTAFVDYVNADSDADRQIHLKAHLESIRKHVKELAAKDYTSYVRPPKVTAGYVIMFVPNMGALWTALNAEPDLWRKAADRNVYIADEQTLYGALKIVSMTWTQVAQAQNHEKVYELANEMIDRVGLFMEKYEAVGKALQKAAEEYDDGMKKLQPQGKSILNTSAKLIRLGAKNSGKHPVKALLDIDDIPALPE